MKRLVMLVLFAAACGGGKDTPRFTPDAYKAPDAAPAACLMAPSMPTVTPGNQEAHAFTDEGETAPTNFYYYGDLNTDETPDVLLIDLYKGYGAFAAGWPTAPTTIQLQGAEIDYSTCGACVLGLTDFTDGAPTGDPYMAVGGTMMLETTGPNMLKGKLTNVQLAHVTVDEDTSATTAHADGCTSMLGSFEFEAAIADEMMMAKGSTRVRAVLKPVSASR